MRWGESLAGLEPEHERDVALDVDERSAVASGVFKPTEPADCLWVGVHLEHGGFFLWKTKKARSITEHFCSAVERASGIFQRRSDRIVNCHTAFAVIGRFAGLGR